MSLVSGVEDRTHSDLSGAEAEVVKGAIRRNDYSGHTAGLCAGLLQCNLVILPAAFAEDFRAFCRNNPIPCPLLGVSEPGRPQIAALGEGMDLRTDLPLYRVYERGRCTEEQRDIRDLWRPDFVAFAIGCSFTFEDALMAAGIEMRHVEENVTVPMFRTGIPTTPSGAFHGPTVVSMRPIKREEVERVREISAAYPHAHGAPLHVGDPAEIGIGDLSRPDWGHAVSIRADEVPVYWGCGVTTQVAIANACPEICITHAPGAMLITGISDCAVFD